MEEVRRSPVEVGSFPHSFTRFYYIPGGDRRSSEPSTVCQEEVGRRKKVGVLIDEGLLAHRLVT